MRNNESEKQRKEKRECYASKTTKLRHSEPAKQRKGGMALSGHHRKVTENCFSSLSVYFGNIATEKTPKDDVFGVGPILHKLMLYKCCVCWV